MSPSGCPAQVCAQLRVGAGTGDDDAKPGGEVSCCIQQFRHALIGLHPPEEQYCAGRLARRRVKPAQLRCGPGSMRNDDRAPGDEPQVGQLGQRGRGVGDDEVRAAD